MPENACFRASEGAGNSNTFSPDRSIKNLEKMPDRNRIEPESLK